MDCKIRAEEMRDGREGVGKRKRKEKDGSVGRGGE